MNTPDAFGPTPENPDTPAIENTENTSSRWRTRRRIVVSLVVLVVTLLATSLSLDYFGGINILAPLGIASAPAAAPPSTPALPPAQHSPVKVQAPENSAGGVIPSAPAPTVDPATGVVTLPPATDIPVDTTPAPSVDTSPVVAPVVAPTPTPAPAPPVALDTPQNVTASGSDNRANIHWSAVPYAAHYEVYRNGTLLGQTSSPSAADSTVVDGTTYTYTVRALSADASHLDSALSTSATVTPVISTPAITSTTVADSSATLNWSAVPAATSYEVKRDGSTLATVTDAPASSPATTFTDTGLANGQSYTYQVIAHDATASSPATVTLDPFATMSFTASPGDTKVGLSWPSVSGATSYTITRDGTTLVSTPALAYTDTSVVNGTAYNYQVTAMNGANQAGHTNVLTATPVAATPPAPPSPPTISGTPAPYEADLSWNGIADAASYHVYRGGVRVDGTNGNLVTAPSGAQTRWTFADGPLTNGTTYTYTVRSVSSSGVEGVDSNTLSITPASATPPPASPPAAPTGLTATPGNQKVTLNWSAVSGATSYKIYRNGSVINSVPSNGAYCDCMLTNGTTYSYQVFAVNSSGTSTGSNTATATPTAPVQAATTTVTVTGTLNTTVTLGQANDSSPFVGSDGSGGQDHVMMSYRHDAADSWTLTMTGQDGSTLATQTISFSGGTRTSPASFTFTPDSTLPGWHGPVTVDLSSLGEGTATANVHATTN